MVSCLTFKSLSQFEFIFVHGMRVCSNFTDLHAAIQLSHHPLLNRLSFSHCIFLPQKIGFLGFQLVTRESTV